MKQRIDKLMTERGLVPSRERAQALILAVTRIIARQGATPFLHVFSENFPAIALYNRLGFTRRKQLYVTRLQRDDT